MTVTTMGYGDVVPLTPLGKFFAGIISLVGIGMAALPAGILASGFATEMRRREAVFYREVRRARQPPPGAMPALRCGPGFFRPGIGATA